MVAAVDTNVDQFRFGVNVGGEHTQPETMVAGAVGNFHSGMRNDPLVREMRRVRELNAKQYKQDYSHVFR